MDYDQILKMMYANAGRFYVNDGCYVALEKVSGDYGIGARLRWDSILVSCASMDILEFYQDGAIVTRYSLGSMASTVKPGFDRMLQHLDIKFMPSGLDWWLVKGIYSIPYQRGINIGEGKVTWAGVQNEI